MLAALTDNAKGHIFLLVVFICFYVLKSTEVKQDSFFLYLIPEIIFEVLFFVEGLKFGDKSLFLLQSKFL